MNIYIMTPYSDPDPTIQEERFLQAARTTALLIRRYGREHTFFSPIVHGHPIAKAGGLPGDFDFWRRLDAGFIKRWAQAGLVPYEMDGWSESAGIQEECDQFDRQFKPVIFWKLEDDLEQGIARAHSALHRGIRAKGPKAQEGMC